MPEADDFALRSMRPADLPAVMALWAATPGVVLNESDTPDALLAYLQRNISLSVVIEDGATLVGAALVGHDGRRGWLHHVAVAASHRGQGLGRALVRQALVALASQNIPKCNVFVVAGNATGQAFWEHLGFAVRSDLIALQRRTPV